MNDTTRVHRAQRGPTSTGLLLSALEIKLSRPDFDGVETPYTDDATFEHLRTRSDIFVYRRNNVSVDKQVLIVPLIVSELRGFERPVTIPVSGHLGMLSALIERRLPLLLSQIERPMRLTHRYRRGLRGLKQSDDLVASTFRRMGAQLPPALMGFHKFGKMDFRTRIVEMHGRDAFIALTVELKRHLKILPSAGVLLQRGIDLKGVWMIDQQSADERLLGSVVGIDGKDMLLAGPDGTRRVEPSKCYPEASLATFSLIFDQVLKSSQRQIYDDTEWLVQAETASGQGYVNRLTETASYFQRAGELMAAPSIPFQFGDLVEARFGEPEPQATVLPPIKYCFSSDRTAMHQFPATGLERFGPFDNRSFDKKTPRILVVAPQESRGETDEFVRRLLDGMPGRDRSRFAKGFVNTYCLSKVILQHVSVQLPRGGPPGGGALYVAAIREAFDSSRPADLALVFLRDSDAFSERDNPYLAAKAYLLSQGVPTQDIRLETVRQGSGLPFSLENVASAMYAKLGGSPWTVLPTMPIAHEIVLGMGLAEVGGRFSSRKRYVGITTVFRSDGAYLLAASSPRCTYDEYPAVLGRFVEETIRRLAVDQNWQDGDLVRLVFHARLPLKRTDVGAIVASAVRQLDAGVQFETSFLTIHKGHPFKIVAPYEQGQEKGVKIAGERFARRIVGRCVPARGTVVDLGETRRLLCINGPLLVKREGEPIPQPLLIELHRDSTYRDMTSLVRQVYHFTGLSWRSMLPVGEPVTTFYSHLIAESLGSLDAVPNWSDGLLDTRLRRSRWFL